MRSVTCRSRPASPGWRDFLATNRGGGLYSEAVSQRARRGHRPGRVPAGPGADRAHADQPGARPGRLGHGGRARAAGRGGLGARLGWSGWSRWWRGRSRTPSTAPTGSWPGSPGRPAPAGARLDVLCDVAAQIASCAPWPRWPSPTGRARRPGWSPRSPAPGWSTWSRRSCSPVPTRPAWCRRGPCRYGWSSWSATTAR